MKEQYLKSAYHESGHIVMTYFAQYSCNGVTIHPNGDGSTDMNYGTDLLLVAAVSNFITEPYIFQGLPQEVKKDTRSVGFRAALILLAGAIAESMHIHNGIPSDNLPVEMSGPDLERVTNIDFLFSRYIKDHSQNFVDENMEDVMITFSVPLVWDTISTLAQAIMAQESMSLDKQQIEEVLSNTGYLDYVREQTV